VAALGVACAVGRRLVFVALVLLEDGRLLLAADCALVDHQVLGFVLELFQLGFQRLDGNIFAEFLLFARSAASQRGYLDLGLWLFVLLLEGKRLSVYKQARNFSIVILT
jgi:hypothetical protein